METKSQVPKWSQKLTILILICAFIALIVVIWSVLCCQENNTFEPNLGSRQRCVYINEKKTMSQEQLERIKEFRQGWLSQDQLSSCNISPEEQQWIFNMNTLCFQMDFVEPTSKGEFKSFEGIKQQGLGGSAPNCHEIPDGLHSQSKYYQLSSKDPTPQRIRKEYRQLSSEERNSLHDTLNKMKKTFPFDRNISIYDFLVQFHRKCMAPTAHFGAAFLPWHRQYLHM